MFKRKQKINRDMALEKAALEVYGIDFDSEHEEIRAAAALALKVRLDRDPKKAELFYKTYAKYSNELESGYTAGNNKVIR